MFFYQTTIFLPLQFRILLLGRTVKGKTHKGLPWLSSDILMRTFLLSKNLVLKVPTIMITEALARCLMSFPPTGQILSLELLVICHVEGSGKVPGPFQIVGMKLQWHDKTVAGEPAVNPWRSMSAFFFLFIRSLLFSFFPFFVSAALSYRHVLDFPLCRAAALFICLVNSVFNHLLTVTELVLIVILRPPRCCLIYLPKHGRRERALEFFLEVQEKLMGESQFGKSLLQFPSSSDSFTDLLKGLRNNAKVHVGGWWICKLIHCKSNRNPPQGMLLVCLGRTTYQQEGQRKGSPPMRSVWNQDDECRRLFPQCFCKDKEPGLKQERRTWIHLR